MNQLTNKSHTENLKQKAGNKKQGHKMHLRTKDPQQAIRHKQLRVAFKKVVRDSRLPLPFA